MHQRRSSGHDDSIGPPTNRPGWRTAQWGRCARRRRRLPSRRSGSARGPGAGRRWPSPVSPHPTGTDRSGGGRSRGCAGGERPPFGDAIPRCAATGKTKPESSGGSESARPGATLPPRGSWSRPVNGLRLRATRRTRPPRVANVSIRAERDDGRCRPSITTSGAPSTHEPRSTNCTALHLRAEENGTRTSADQSVGTGRAVRAWIVALGDGSSPTRALSLVRTFACRIWAIDRPPLRSVALTRPVAIRSMTSSAVKPARVASSVPILRLSWRGDPDERWRLRVGSSLPFPPQAVRRHLFIPS